jgi:hypothetical protein
VSALGATALEPGHLRPEQAHRSLANIYSVFEALCPSLSFPTLRFVRRRELAFQPSFAIYRFWFFSSTRIAEISRLKPNSCEYITTAPFNARQFNKNRLRTVFRRTSSIFRREPALGFSLPIAAPATPLTQPACSLRRHDTGHVVIDEYNGYQK